ncbi:LysR substrate-binding domain-containing protein [Paracoccus alcaliphilus]|nr:LysR substrate-binding domain-containing protein [Paracoccus alcaliphilus]
MHETAIRIDEEIIALSRQVTGQDQRLSGLIRITAIDMLAIGLLPPHLAAFHAAQPGIELEVIVSDTPLDLTRREADVALRIGNTPQETLVGRRVGRLAFGAYVSAERAAHGLDDDLAGNDWIGFGRSHGAIGHQLADWLPTVRPIYRTNSISAAIAAARAGIGLAPLPCAVADRTPDLVRIAMFPEDFRLDLWLLTHEDLRNTARIRAFMDFMADALAADADLLEGRRPQAGPPRTTTA